MELSITSEDKGSFVFINSAGTISSLPELMEQTDLLHKEFLKYERKNILLDETQTKLPTNLYSYHQIANHYVDSFPPQANAIKLAIILTEEYQQLGEFWELACANRGFNFAAFTDREKAIAFLEI